MHSSFCCAFCSTGSNAADIGISRMNFRLCDSDNGLRSALFGIFDPLKRFADVQHAAENIMLFYTPAFSRAKAVI